MKKGSKGTSIGASIAIGICGIIFIVIEWFVIAIVIAAIGVKGITSLDKTLPDLDEAFDFDDYDDYTVDDAEYDDFEIYEDKTLGIRFRYPEEFDVKNQSTQGGYTTIMFYDDETGSSVNLVTGSITQNLTLDEYITSSIAGVKKSNNLEDKDITIVKDNVYMGGKKAFTDSYKVSGVNIYQCATLVSKTEYVLTYGGKDGYFSKEEGDKVFASFEFLDKSNSSSTSTSNVTSSDKSNAVELNSWCTASKYNANTGKYDDVKVKVTKITRGNEARTQILDYAKTDEYFDYDEPDKGEEWVVIDYDVDLSSISIPSYGISPYLTVDIVGTGNKDSVEFNGKKYYPITYRVSSTEFVTNPIASNKIATTLPVGCENYLIEFGAYSHTLGYVKGK